MTDVDLTISLTDELHPLTPRGDLTSPRQLKACFLIPLDGDLVMSPEHLGPAYLTAVLRNAGAMVRITEVSLAKDESAILHEIAKWNPDLVGISLTSINIPHAQQFGEQLRHCLGPTPFIVGGGPLATYCGAELLKKKGWAFLDGLIRGEGEIPILRLAETIHSKGDLMTVPNLVYRSSSGIIEQNSMTRPVENLDELPDPARDQFEQHNRKLSYLRISTSRGCTAHCTFCNAPHARNRVSPSIKGWRGASPERVVDEIERLVYKYKFHTFDFVDSTFEDPGGGTIAKARVRRIAEEIIARDLTIYYNVCMQARNWYEEDWPLIDLLWRSGLEKVNVGIESGSEIGLKRWQKKSTVEDNRRFIRLLKKANVCVTFGFIAFHPWSTFEEVKENCQFLYEIKGHNLRRMLERLELYPGSEVIEQLRSEGLLLPDYDTHLNPFAYSYVDPRIGLLASALNSIYGDDYEKDCLIITEPAVFEFETYDVILNNYVSRILRNFGQDAPVADLIHEFSEEVDQVRQEIANFNYEFVSTMVSLAEAERLTREMVTVWAEPIERFFRERIDRLRTLQLRSIFRLHRSGYPVKAIQTPHEILAS